MIRTQDTRLTGGAIRAIILGAVFGFLLQAEMRRAGPNYLIVGVLAVLTVLPVLRACRLEKYDQPPK